MNIKERKASFWIEDKTLMDQLPQDLNRLSDPYLRTQREKFRSKELKTSDFLEMFR